MSAKTWHIHIETLINSKTFLYFLIFFNIQPILPQNVQELQPHNIYQQQFLENTPFFCNLSVGTRSETVPSSVHKLTPGDIDVVAAIGDSSTAAFGAVATNMLDFLKKIESKGLSWSIGGQLDWNRYFTLPNILKLYNPNIYGYSLNVSSPGFNEAVTGALSSDSMRQASAIVSKMYQDPKVDIQNHWKLITILIGSNDFGKKICNESDDISFLRSGGSDLINALRYLRDNLPRTLVNVVLPLDFDALSKMKNIPSSCGMFLEALIPCIGNAKYSFQTERYLRVLKMWRLQMEAIVDFAEFHDSDTFEVTLHRFTEEAIIPTFPNGNTDMSYLSIDCLHFSPKGHAFMANALWNSMLTPEKQRARTMSREFTEVKCPTPNNPYLATSKNS